MVIGEARISICGALTRRCAHSRKGLEARPCEGRKLRAEATVRRVEIFRAMLVIFHSSNASILGGGKQITVVWTLRERAEKRGNLDRASTDFCVVGNTETNLHHLGAMGTGRRVLVRLNTKNTEKDRRARRSSGVWMTRVRGGRHTANPLFLWRDGGRMGAQEALRKIPPILQSAGFVARRRVRFPSQSCCANHTQWIEGYDHAECGSDCGAEKRFAGRAD